MRGKLPQVDEIKRREAESPHERDEEKPDDFAFVFFAHGLDEQRQPKRSENEQRRMREPDRERACEDKERCISQPCFNANAANVRIPYGYDVTRIFS